MIKVLILAYDFPPYVSVGGLRPYGWSKYMRESDAFPVVVTRQWGDKYGNLLDYVAPGDSPETVYEESGRSLIIRTPYEANFSNKLLLNYGDSRFKLTRRSYTALFEIAQFFAPIGPKSELYRAAQKYLANNRADAIIATGEPFVLFKYASELSAQYKIPWIADYRDPWTQNKNRRNLGIPRNWDAYLEKRFLANASAVTTVSEYFRQQIETLIPDKPFYIVPNGYDPEVIHKVQGINQTDEKLKIALVGTINKWHPLESVLRVCGEFVSHFPQTPHFEINFYGIDREAELRHLLETKYPNLKNLVRIHPKMSNERLVKHLAANNVFLLFNEYTSTGTKIYEYVALKRTIILCYRDDPEANELKAKYYDTEKKEPGDEYPQHKILEETGSGLLIKDAAHLRSILTDFYIEFETKGFIPCNPRDVERHSRKIQVGNLVEIIRRTIAANNNGGRH